MENYRKIVSKNYSNLTLRVIPGHFVTVNSHINYYIDMSLMKSRQSEASMVAHAISSRYISSTIVDTIVCMDGCEVIGTYLANYLTETGFVSINSHKTMYIVAPESSRTGELLFRENIQHMIQGKHVILLFALASTGKTVTSAVDAILHYGGTIVGISAIFSAAAKIYDYPINALFTANDIPDYHSYESSNCALCQKGKSIDAIANGYGFARL